MKISKEEAERREKAIAVLEAMRPRDADALHAFVEAHLRLRVPRLAVVPGSAAPFDYLAHAFFEEEGAGDAVVWASRGGGKTVLGAAATLLDLLFKPGIGVRILAGSLEQSSRMFEHLVSLARLEAVRPYIAGEPTQRRVKTIHGSTAALLAHSHASIRGVRVQKLRCDEVELLDPELWRAAQLTTRSRKVRGGGELVRGRVEAMSTFHKPAGLMSELVAKPGVRLFRWTAIDVVDRCAAERSCGPCVLRDDCGGRAKEADGFLPVDDLVQMRLRTDDATWNAEMMCRRPTMRHAVFPGFSVERHVSGSAGKQENRNAGNEEAKEAAPVVLAGMDFGLRAPLVMLWARWWPGVFPSGDAADDARPSLVEVFDEHHEEGRTLDEHLAMIEARGHGRPAWVGIDPAGLARNAQTGLSDAQVLRRKGYVVRARRTAIRLGLDVVRRRLDRGTLAIHPRCVRLIAALQTYHYPPERAEEETPAKDGPDHACDALRYLLVNLELAGRRVDVRGY